MMALMPFLRCQPCGVFRIQLGAPKCEASQALPKSLEIPHVVLHGNELSRRQEVLCSVLRCVSVCFVFVVVAVKWHMSYHANMRSFIDSSMRLQSGTLPHQVWKLLP